MTFLRKRNKQHKDLRQDPRYQPQVGPTRTERERRIENKEWSKELSEFKRGLIQPNK